MVVAVVTDLLCVNPACAVPGRHATDCADPADCRGCQPALARDGLWLCGHCTDHIGTDAIEAARLHGELALVLAGTGGSGGPRVSGGGPAAGIALNEAAVKARETVQAVLASWCRMIAEERGLTPPAAHMTALGAYVRLHREWLAGHGAAADACGEIRGLVTLARPIARPDRAAITRSLGHCPMLVDGEPCSGMIQGVMRRPDSLTASAVTCDKDRSHAWDSTQWIELAMAVA